MFSLTERSLYFCTPLRDDLADFARAVVDGGVDVLQLREKHADRDTLLRAAAVLREVCHEYSVPFIINDDPELALAGGADGVHVGQDDVSVARCRELLGEDAIIGISTHEDAEFTAALALPVTYRSAGPVVATPTKAGRAPAGVDYAVRCQRASNDPVFVTGGVDDESIGHLLERGLRHFVVVRALTEASDPGAAARRLRRRIDESR